MPISVFVDKENVPSEKELQRIIGDTYAFWSLIQKAACNTEVFDKAAWHFSGQKYGWSYRISDKKRVLIYLLPRDGFFKVAFVFGDKAVEMVKKSTINPKIREEILAAKKYAEGRGIRIVVIEDSDIPDVLTLLEIKIKSL